MNIFITGGFGYLGSHVVKLFLEDTKDKIIVGTRERKNTPQYFKGTDIIDVNWDNLSLLKNKLTKIDLVIHLAGMNAQNCLKNPSLAQKFNASKTKELIDICADLKIKRFIYISTAHVYSSSLQGNVNEDSPVTNTHPYSTSKREAEKYLMQMHKKNLIEGVILRLSNAYGAPLDKNTDCWSLVLNDACKQLALTNKIVLKSSGLQRRDFITMTDASRAIKFLSQYEKLNDVIYNVGGNWSPTILETIEILRKRYFRITQKQTHLETKVDDNLSDYYLKYEIDKIKNLGFCLSENQIINSEIDGLINFCISNFKK